MCYFNSLAYMYVFYPYYRNIIRNQRKALPLSTRNFPVNKKLLDLLRSFCSQRLKPITFSTVPDHQRPFGFILIKENPVNTFKINLAWFAFFAFNIIPLSFKTTSPGTINGYS